MGNQDVDGKFAPEERRAFVRSLINDLRALDWMIANEMIESGVRRIGAEQELFLVNSSWRPSPVAMQVLERINDPHFTNEIALFNLEVNLDPMAFDGDCLWQMERELNRMVAKARAVAHTVDSEIVLTGILPTVRKSDLELSNMTPKPRYFALNNALKHQRGWAYEFKIRGADELNIRHESWMLEACCTSFQIHFQSGADEFANLYNTAQVATAPVLAAATNSPLLFGKRLWRETRVPLFEQSIDTRNASYHLRERVSRVSFGNAWVEHSALELFEEDIARFRVLLGTHVEEDPFEALKQGRAPQLHALKTYNSTIWRWNRPCYGVTDDKPHLRIEARAFPSGPTVADEMANAAFFFGLMSGLSAEHPKIARDMEFNDAKANFLAATEHGLDAQFTWFGGKVIPARELICRYLLPIAGEGLAQHGIAREDITRYLGIIEKRVRSGRTGAQWSLNSLAEMRKAGTSDEALTALTAAMVSRQKVGMPVHEWELAQLTEGDMSKPSYARVEEFMTTDLFTVQADEPLDLVANLMAWKHVRHIPVEDEQGRLVGLISCFEVMREFERCTSAGVTQPIPVSSIMKENALTITPDTLTLDAIALMRREKVDCLPVVKEGRLIGIVTERDFIHVAARLLERMKDEEGKDEGGRMKDEAGSLCRKALSS